MANLVQEVPSLKQQHSHNHLRVHNLTLTPIKIFYHFNYKLSQGLKIQFFKAAHNSKAIFLKESACIKILSLNHPSEAALQIKGSLTKAMLTDNPFKPQAPFRMIKMLAQISLFQRPHKVESIQVN